MTSQTALFPSDLMQKAEGISQLIKTKASEISQFIRQSPVETGATLGGSVLAGLGITQIVKRVSHKKKKRTYHRKGKHHTQTRSRRSLLLDRAKRSKQKHEVYYWKHRKKRKSSRRKKSYQGKKVYYTKHGQPYIKLSSGKARFIKK